MYEDNNEYQNYSNMPYDNTQQYTEQSTDNGSTGGFSNGTDTNGAVPDGTGHRNKKGGSLWKKVGVSALCAVVFGCVAGTTMVGINRIGGGSNGTQAVAEASSESTPETEAQTPAAESSASASASGDSTSGSTAGSTNLDVSGIVEKAMPSVVSINVKGEQQYSDFFGRTQSYEVSGAGSGILIGENDDEYLIVTNNHVVENTNSMSVQFIDGTSADAELKGTDSKKDVAVIAVKKSDISSDTKNQISIAKIGNSDNLKVGQGVIAIGNALGYGQSVTVGYVSALNRTISATDSATGESNTVENLLQTDAAINPGNSGGALLNMNGEVIGINESKSVSTSVEGIGYAIPISTVTDLIQTLSNQKTRAVVAEADRGYIGIQGQNVDADTAKRYNMPEGIFVYHLIDGGAAKNSDLKESDIITEFEGQTVSTIEELQQKLSYYSKGETVTLTVERPNGGSYEEKKIQITLAAQGNEDGASGNTQGSQNNESQAQNGADNGADGSADGSSDGSGNSGSGSQNPFGNLFNNGFQFSW